MTQSGSADRQRRRAEEWTVDDIRDHALERGRCEAQARFGNVAAQKALRRLKAEQRRAGGSGGTPTPASPADPAAAAEAEAQAAKLEAAVKHGLTEDDLELLGTGTPEEIEQRAEKLAARLNASKPSAKEKGLEEARRRFGEPAA